MCFLTFGAFIVLTFTSDVRSPKPILGGGERNVVEVLGTNLPADGLQLAAGVVVVAILLTVLYRFTSFGIATRAAAENDTSAALVGISANRLALTNVLMSSVLAGVVGVLVTPSTGLDPFTIPKRHRARARRGPAGEVHLVPDRGRGQSRARCAAVAREALSGAAVVPQGRRVLDPGHPRPDASSS